MPANSSMDSKSSMPMNGQVVAFGDSFHRGARPSQPDLAIYRGARPSRPDLSALSGAGSTTGKPPADAFMALASFVGAPTPTTVDVTVPAPTTMGDDASSAPLFEITSEIAEGPVPVHYQYVQNGNNLMLAYSFHHVLMELWRMDES
ncbi:hypothetical protein GGF32_000336 [Allomyces javanicus]|nr:hypothetical protein GGF32_000336 [Allomyces javanicus]